MKEILLQAKAFILPMSLIANLLLIYLINDLPQKISEAINLPAKDTVIITKTITAQLQNTGHFIYFQGTIQEDSKKYNEEYSYDIEIPSEIYDGYLTYVKDYSGGEYLMWSKNKIFKTSITQEIRGWFVTDGIALFQRGDKNLQGLYPIVEKKVSD